MLRTLPPLLCPHCGACAVPLLGPGAGQHVARALCGQCGRFLRWLPRALMEGKDPAMGGLSRAIVLGTVSKAGVEVRYSTSGTPCASFTLVVSERGQDGKEHPTFIDCECWGKKAESAGELEA